MNMNTFPMTFEQHLIFCIVAVLFMVLQFVRQRYWYQLVIAAAVGCSLLIYVNDNTGWFYGIGVLELALMGAALVLYVVQSRKLAKEEVAAEQAAAEADSGDENTESDADAAAPVAEIAENVNIDIETAEPSADEAAAEDNV